MGDDLERGMAAVAERLNAVTDERDDARRALKELVRVEDLSARGSDQYDPEEYAAAWQRARELIANTPADVPPIIVVGVR